jgi:hypothetical protein
MTTNLSMNASSTTSTKFDMYIAEQYILRHVNDLSVSERQTIYKIINDSETPDRYIRCKGSGTEIPMKHIPEKTFEAVYNFIRTKITDKQAALQAFPDSS